MSKLGRTELVKGVQEELVTYLRNGTVNERAVAQALDITDLEIEDLNRLKRIHFCLSDDVVEFVEALQERLRRIQTANQRDREVTHGEVRGAIDWPATTRLRYGEAAGDRTRFACKTPNTEYDIDENLVLKKLLWIVHSTVQEDISAIDYKWRTEAWPTDRIAMFDRIYARNVHLDRIRDAENIRVTQRMLNTARTARQPLYTDAYTLYDRYRRLLAGAYTDLDISQLLSSTLVIPERLPRLFELFCIFRLLRRLSSQGLRLQPIEAKAAQLAVLEGDQYTIDVYHDQGGKLSFYVPLSKLDDIDADYVRRYRNIQHRHGSLIEAFLGNETRPSLFNGRPDFVFEVYESRARDVLIEVILGEIKYSDSPRTFTRGLEELLKYIEFAQQSGYLSDKNIDTRGLLISDGVQTNRNTSIDGQIFHIPASNLLSETFSDDWIPKSI
ncbi:hypothetical protein HAPAU_41150 [Halalkalicoccus paucihalophilus]|uniref:Uncharacterized protein n=1 Tax=Halalkalicoccus paucihalophilus TaxID=1008153 RepID=A0A151A8L7_9EURY|nr:hypothetical protein [Halalkalicoccus paucihalophilus]KYH24036.1 hypothetical protein HAPAU_41150 [Halalkalicoccus paucihalophilus]